MKQTFSLPCPRFLSGAALIILLTALPVACAESPAAFHIEAAQGYMAGNQWDYANFEWRAALEADPNSLEANLGYAKSLMQAGLHQQALDHLVSARGLVQDKQLDLLLAEAYAKSGYKKEAERIYRDVLNRSPYDAQAFGRLTALAKGMSTDEQAGLKPFLQQYARQAEQKALAALARKDYTEAARYYELFSAYSRKTGVLNDYGVIQLLAGNRKIAGRQLSSLSAKHEMWQVRANKALSDLSLGKIRDAREAMEQAIGLCKDGKAKARLYNNLGYIYEQSAKPVQARYAYEHALQLDPTFTKARMNLAYIFLQAEEHERAIEIYKQVLKRDQHNADAWNQLGFAYELRHDAKPAIKAYERAIAVDPNSKEAYFNLGTLYKKQNKVEASNEIIKRMMERQFNSLEASTGKAPAGRDERRAEGADAERQPKLLKYVDVFTTRVKV
jgi:tetratricopeptide (TPR) repeat protein